MKTSIYFIFFCIFFTFSCEKINEKETYYENKQLKERWNITNEEGKEFKNGPYTSWYESGAVKEKSQFVDDKKHGLQRIFHETGKRKLIANYLFGELNGELRKYDKNGKLLSSRIYVKGKKNGPGFNYHQSGKIMAKVNYINDKKHGLKITYSKTGEVTNAVWFENGTQAKAPSDSAKVVEMEKAKDLTVSSKANKDPREKPEAL